MSELTIVKVGGGVVDDETSLEQLMAGIRALAEVTTVAIVHGGGPQSTEMAAHFQHTPTIVQGRRVTGDLDLHIALSTICGVVNSKLVAALVAAGVPAIGLTGASNRMIAASRRPPWSIEGVDVDFGHVGDIESVDPEPIKVVAAAGYVPVVASIGLSEQGKLLNINADTTAAEIAVAVGARKLLIVTTAGGLLRSDRIIDSCDESLIEEGIADGWITDGMHVKLKTGLRAARAGVIEVRIVAPETLATHTGGTRLVAIQAQPQRHGFSAPRDTPRDAVEILKTLIRFPSVTGSEREIADWVERWARSLNLGVGRFENSVYCWIGDGDDCLLLNSHLDVVPPSSDHPYPPFDPIEVDGAIYGRGSVDAKASGAAMLASIARLAGQDWRPHQGRLLVALTECEEGTGLRNGLNRLLPHLPPLAGGIIGEPTSLEPCTSQKGMLILKGTARGRSAHAARPHLGINAVEKAARDVARLQDYSFDRIHPDLGRTSIAVTTISGGSARNVIPEECIYFLDIRTTPVYTHEEIIKELQALLESELTVHSGRYVPRSTPSETRIAVAVSEALTSGTPFGSPTVSDWAFLEDTPAVKLGPGDSNLSHTGAECIMTAEIDKAVDVYTDVAKAFFARPAHQEALAPLEIDENVRG